MTNRIKIDFLSEGTKCAGDLVLPTEFDDSQSYPAIILGHGFTVARSSLVEESRLFAEAGYIVLTIDYRHFGESEGNPRGRLWPLQESEDFKSALDWFEQHPNVDPDNIGIWGTSFGGGIVTHVAASDLRVKACVAQAPIFDGDYWLRSLNRECDYLAIRKYLLEARRKRAAEGGDPVYIPAEASKDGFAPMPNDPAMIEDIMGWLEQTGEMLMHTAPEMTIESFERVMEFDATYTARKIAPRPYCIIQLTGHDVYHPNQPIQAAYKAAGEPKQIYSIAIDQLDCYKTDGRAKTIGAAIDFFDKYLK